MRKLFLILTALLLVSCSPIKGIFEVTEDLTFKGQKYMLGRRTDIPVSGGNYEAKMSMETKRTLLLVLKHDEGEPTKIRFRIPKKLSFQNIMVN